MAIQLNPELSIDRGQPYRRLLDGTHEATILACETYQKNSLTLKVEVVVHPKDTKNAPEGPVLVTTYLPLEVTEKSRDTSKAANFQVACGTKVGEPMEERDQIGKPIRVVSRWEKSREQQYPDRAEIRGFLPPLPGQKPMVLPEAPAPAPAEHPFGES